jgi:hypothetical protein
MRVLISVTGFVVAMTSIAPAQAIRGVVRDVSSSLAVAAAQVALIGRDGRVHAHTTTDANGSFDVHWESADSVRLRVERLGYRSSNSPYFLLDRGSTISTTVQISEDAILLDSVLVKARSRHDIGGVLAGIARRRATGHGHFIERQHIVESGITRISELLESVPRISLVPDRQSGFIINAYTHFNSALQNISPSLGRRRRITSQPQTGGCPMQVFIDGQISRGNLFGVNVMPAQDVEAIEVYRGLAEVPMEFSGEHARCGVVAIWTRRS